MTFLPSPKARRSVANRARPTPPANRRRLECWQSRAEQSGPLGKWRSQHSQCRQLCLAAQVGKVKKPWQASQVRPWSCRLGNWAIPVTSVQVPEGSSDSDTHAIHLPQSLDTLAVSTLVANHPPAKAWTSQTWTPTPRVAPGHCTSCCAL